MSKGLALWIVLGSLIVLMAYLAESGTTEGYRPRADVPGCITC